MALYGDSFLQILQNDSPVSYENLTPVSHDNSLQWGDDEDSFEVTEITNAASSDTNLAEALRSISTGHGSLKVQTTASECTNYQERNRLKEELKAKIQTRRKTEGVDELCVQFEEPKSYPLTPEERNKVLKRKHRNKLSANKSRLKRKIHEDNLKKEVEDLETENDKLSKEVKFLQNIKHVLSLKMANHQCTRQDMTSSGTTQSTERNGACTNTQTTSQQKTNLDFNTASRCFEPLKF